MKKNINNELLKEILDNLTTPEQLNNHPWTKNHFVLEACSRDSSLKDQAPGIQLVEAISQIFEKTIPSIPPRRGLRLDTRWGEFGLLASLYFAPYRLGMPQPATLREAWLGIDKAILFFVFGQESQISEEDRQRYQLISGETDIAPNSTISDWHRKGLEYFESVITLYENKLRSNPTSETNRKNWFPQLPKKVKTIIWLAIITMVTTTLAWFGFRGWQIFQRIQSLDDSSRTLLAVTSSFSDPDKLIEVGQTVSEMRMNLEALKAESDFFLKITPYLGWIPKYGGDLSQTPDLLELAIQLSITGDEAFQAVAPSIITSNTSDSSLKILDLLSNLKDGSSRLLVAQSALSSARATRQRIDSNRLSPRLQNLLNDKIDPYLLSIQSSFPVDDVLAMARLAPRLLGSVGNGPQNYLLMVQNEDELRSTGGFFSAVGLLVVENGKIVNLSFESTELVDDLSRPYPSAPWQLDEYMMADMLLLRDANWFTDFPTTVEWVRFLYAYTRTQSIQGVIAIDQNVLVEILRHIGALRVEGETEEISSDNILQYMRTAKEQTPPEGISRLDWDRKKFISRLASPLLKKLMACDSETYQALINKFIQLLDEKHVLLFVDDPEMKDLLIRRGWDGSVLSKQNSDFLMVVDNNVGFNKTYAVMNVSQDYSIDLSNLERPVATTTIKHTNNAVGSIECIQRRSALPNESKDELDYRINDCYWSYLRIYTPADTKMISSTPHQIPAPLPLREQEIPARTDILNEGIPGIQVFGTLFVVPTSQSLETSFTYQLPSSVVTYNADKATWTYTLNIQKQPGTKAIPLSISLKLPHGMKIKNTSSELIETSDGWSFLTDLQKDRFLQIEFEQAVK